MEKIFEDEFMEVQSNMVSLALELVDNSAMKQIYLYASIENANYVFNAFFKTENQVVTASEIGKSHEIIRAFLRMGTDEVERLASVCQKYQKPVPIEIKAVYSIDTNSLDAKYQYQPVCTLENEKNPNSVFVEWRNSIKNDCQKG